MVNNQKEERRSGCQKRKIFTKIIKEISIAAREAVAILKQIPG